MLSSAYSYIRAHAFPKTIRATSKLAIMTVSNFVNSRLETQQKVFVEWSRVLWVVSEKCGQLEVGNERVTVSGILKMKVTSL